MAKSRYATKHGVCIASACKGVLLRASSLARTRTPAGQRMAPILRAVAAKIGITLRPQPGSSPDGRRRATRPIVAHAPTGGRTRRTPRASSTRSSTGAGIQPTDNPNTSLLGITPAQAARLGVKGRVRGVPSVDRRPRPLRPADGRARIDCYAALDRKLTAEIVPWIPFLWRNRITILGPQVARWAFDQAVGTTAFAHVAVKG